MRWMRILARLFGNEWRDISTAPHRRTLELAVIDSGVHAAEVPCIRNADGWIDATTMRPVQIRATHWRYWNPDLNFRACC